MDSPFWRWPGAWNTLLGALRHDGHALRTLAPSSVNATQMHHGCGHGSRRGSRLNAVDFEHTQAVTPAPPWKHTARRAGATTRAGIMRKAGRIAFVLGLAAAIALIAWVGFDVIARAIERAGWRALSLPLIFILPLSLAAWSWRLVTPESARPSVMEGLRATWIGLGVNWLLPVAQVGGEVVKARLLIRRGAPTDAAVAAVVVDKTLQVATQLIFTLVGATLFAAWWSGREVIVAAVGGTVPLLLGLVVFYRLQNRGLFGGAAHTFLRAFRKGDPHPLVADAQKVDRAVEGIYRRRRATLLAGGVRLAFRFSLAIETAIALTLLGHPRGIVEVIVLESLGQAVRGGSFLIPAGLGVQEGAYIVLAKALGLPPEVGLAVSLLKRGREVLVGAPALVVWHLDELRRKAGRETCTTEPRR